VGDDGGDSDGCDLLERDFTRYEVYWHGFTLIIYDTQNPEAWVRSTFYVPVAGFGEDESPEDE